MHSSQATEILVHLSLLRALLTPSSACSSDHQPSRKPEHCMWCTSGPFTRCLPVPSLQGRGSSRLTVVLQAELTPPLSLQRLFPVDSFIAAHNCAT